MTQDEREEEDFYWGRIYETTQMKINRLLQEQKAEENRINSELKSVGLKSERN